jgi:hypothetical protein
MTSEKPGPMSQQVWHDKDPSLLKGPERQAYAYILQSFTGFHISEKFLSET